MERDKKIRVNILNNSLYREPSLKMWIIQVFGFGYESFIIFSGVESVYNIGSVR